MLKNATEIHLACRMLTHKMGRLILSMLGVAFAVVIMFMEMGFFHGINDSQARLLPLLNADLVMMARSRYSMVVPNRFQQIRLQQTMAFDEVAEIIPLYEETGLIRNSQDHRMRSIHMLAFPPENTSPLLSPELERFLPQLRIKGNVVFDRLSRDIYGEVRSGGEITLNNRPHTVVGSVEIGPGAWIDGYVIMADVSMENRAVDKINLGLIRVRPGVDLQALKARLLASLPDDILIMTPEEARVREVDFTTEKAPTGAVFSAGVAIGFLIGVILCYQILYNEITDHLPQYATMKAMGFSRRFMIRLVVKQALLLSILGFIPGLAGGYLLYALIEHYTQILMMLTLWRGLLVLALTVFMCTFAGFLAARKVLNADPAELY